MPTTAGRPEPGSRTDASAYIGVDHSSTAAPAINGLPEKLHIASAQMAGPQQEVRFRLGEVRQSVAWVQVPPRDDDEDQGQQPQRPVARLVQ